MRTGGPDEDRDGGFAHGGRSHPFFDPEATGTNVCVYRVAGR